MANNIFFYSTHPDDKESAEFLRELDKNPLLKKQVILINIYQHKIPDIVKKTGKIPVLVTEGFNEFITGTAAISWLKNGGFQSKANGYEYADMNTNIDSVILTDEMKKKSDSLFVNSSYNRGFDKSQPIINSGYLSFKSDSHIDIYDDSGESKLDNKVSSSKLRTVSSSRKTEDAEIKKFIDDDKKSRSSLPFLVPPSPQQQSQQNQQNQQNQQRQQCNLPFSVGQQRQELPPSYNPTSFAPNRAQLPFRIPQQQRNKNI